MDSEQLDKIKATFPSGVVATSCQLGEACLVLEPGHLLPIATWLRDQPTMGFNVPIDCTVVDWWQKKPLRFEVVWHLFAFASKQRLRLKVQLPQEQPQCSSLTPIWPGMNWHEREAYDLYGIHFVNHPDLRRILLYEPFDGHPLRKDYPIDKRQPLIPMREVKPVRTQREATPSMLNAPS